MKIAIVLFINLICISARADNELAKKFCAEIISRVEAGGYPIGEAHPEYTYFSTLSLIISNATWTSDQVFEQYAGLNSLKWTAQSVNEDMAFTAQDRKRKKRARGFLNLFSTAAKRFEDDALARLFHHLIEINNHVRSDLSIYLQCGLTRNCDEHTDLKRLDYVFTNVFASFYDENLRELQAAWNELTPKTQFQFLDWFGEAVSSGMSSARTFTIKSSPAPVEPSAPEAAKLLQGPPREVALQVLNIFGITEVRQAAPETSFALLSKITRLLGL